jgi:dethiobiotin synthetase
MKPIFISGIGTGIGKTVIAAIIAEALKADYWKPVQAGYEPGTDRGLVASPVSNSETVIHPGTDRALVTSLESNSETVIHPGTDRALIASLVSNSETVIHPETYLLKLAVSPHIAAQKENKLIELKKIADELNEMDRSRPLVIEGAGGLMVPLNEQEFVIDLVKMLDARLVLVSRNYLGSINHSLMTAAICRNYGLDVAGWVFNDQYMNYEQEIVRWSGYPALFSLPLMTPLSKQAILAAAESIPPEGMGYLYESL